MIALIQRVNEASVKIDNNEISSIKKGLLIFLGITHNDDLDDVSWLCNKIVNLRIFDDSDGIMNRSCIEECLDILTISQFTLHARTKKGNRPSYIDSAVPENAIPLYNSFISSLDKLMNKKTYTGEFGADMKVSLINNGPVTIIIDSKNKR
ncbi:MAG TPA: D-aminoacyl-tRNA deacylase [Bacteroidales bacterium]|nr:D-aminoacyl-tRNA deacylase [Bacteroidales bacterium]